MFEDIEIAIEKQILLLQQDGTVGMSLGNLFQVTKEAWGLDRTTFNVLARDAAESAGFEILAEIGLDDPSTPDSYQDDLAAANKMFQEHFTIKPRTVALSDSDICRILTLLPVTDRQTRGIGQRLAGFVGSEWVDVFDDPKSHAKPSRDND